MRKIDDSSSNAGICFSSGRDGVREEESTDRPVNSHIPPESAGEKTTLILHRSPRALNQYIRTHTQAAHIKVEAHTLERRVRAPKSARRR